MSNLECSVSTCAYYAENRCCKPGIHVSGRQAENSADTCCASYEEKSKAAANNTARCDCPNTSSEISCDACNCKYNEDGRCEADCVCVSCCCSDPKCESETECATFILAK